MFPHHTNEIAQTESYTGHKWCNYWFHVHHLVEQGSDVADNRGLSSQPERPEEHIEKEELKKMLAEALQLLTEKERKVIVLYYYEELTLKEISNVLEVSESRISQLHTKGLSKMKTKMGNYMGILTNGL